MRAGGAGRHFQLRIALVIQRRFRQFAERAARIVSHVTEDEARPLLGQRKAVALDLEGRQQPIAGGRRPVQVVALHVDRQVVADRQHFLSSSHEPVCASSGSSIERST
ncbi:hypothetical protein G6F40_015864 [Rhizopus arrhizus]|nr:hypothetical protein G6F40_015864 [Rhizopus arrhizus]